MDTRLEYMCILARRIFTRVLFFHQFFVRFPSSNKDRFESIERVMDDDYLYIINIFDWLGGKLLREFRIFQSNIFSIHLVLTLVYVPRRFLLLFFSSLEFLFLFHTSFISRVVYHESPISAG